MPNRYIREDAIKSRRVNSLTWQGEVFYRRLLNKVDDFGRYHADPMILLGDVFPRQMDKVTVADVKRLLLECEKSVLVSRYKGQDGEDYLIVHKWEKGRAQSSKFPEPPENICERAQGNVYSREHLRTAAPDSDPDNDPDPDSDPTLPQNWEAWMSNPDFLAVWKDWHKSRKQKPTEIQFKKLERLSAGNLQTATAIVKESAENGWKGLFPLKGTANGTPRLSKSDRLDADAADFRRQLEGAGG